MLSVLAVVTRLSKPSRPTSSARENSMRLSSAGQWKASQEHLGGPFAGIKRSALEESRPHWAIYFAVKDAERRAQAASKLVATVFDPLTSANGLLFAGIRSPQGVPFYVRQRGA